MPAGRVHSSGHHAEPGTVTLGDVIYFDHPGGGGVFGIPSVAVGSALAGDPVATQISQNVLTRFLQP